MKAINIIFSVLWLGTPTFSTLANDDLECPAAEKIAQKSYDRTAASYNDGDKNSAIMYSKSFFDIYEISSNCTFVTELAENLNGIGITKTSVVSNSKSLLFPSKVGSLVNTCQNPPCKITLTTPSNGHYNGIQTPEFKFKIP